jgi:hypothetical protein
MMAEWGLKWGQGRIGPDDLDSQLLIWGIRQHIDREDIAAQEFVLRFDFRGIPKGSRTPRHWWMLIRRDEIEGPQGGQPRKPPRLRLASFQSPILVL